MNNSIHLHNRQDKNTGKKIFTKILHKKKWLLFLGICLIFLSIGTIYYLMITPRNIGCYPSGREKSVDELDQIIDKLTQNKPDSLFRGKAAIFVKAGQTYRVDPVLLLSIAMLETDRGTSSVLKKYNNPGGIMRTDDPSSFETFSSLDRGISRMAWILRSYYLSEKRFTPEQIGPKWAPTGADNDPFQTNAHWPSHVRTFVTEFGGLTYQCKTTDEPIPAKP
ncbi:glucosaminidase domain-containing protein [Thermoflavimicrobium dichotomicum]|uniref:Mannosyl-glycoprotein endo-beta-N-acetylglucosaminidase n=1 Tax=Thermoflavimicrobium dichotomicum TaxID=46223 RepID=A0A1I3VFV0_9BACL|nr:glucosaminidase domain-containing protein [Thermoflavimicrobium dichotomicum]SFJ93067.1 Mannosyl-glycoprotein endo-beta-N-acetylglucosaminidase [Thermoflavimicrobium dichotomicum]